MNRYTPFSQRFEAKIDRAPGFGPNGDCWRWVGTIVGGYGQIRRHGKKVYAHRAAYEMKHGDLVDVRAGGPLVCHSCDNRACVNDAHLFLGSNADNMQDMIRKGRQVIRDNAGDANPQSKLNAEQVCEIRADKRRLTEIADDYAIQPSTVSLIRNGKRWSHLHNNEVLK